MAEERCERAALRERAAEGVVCVLLDCVTICIEVSCDVADGAASARLLSC